MKHIRVSVARRDDGSVEVSYLRHVRKDSQIFDDWNTLTNILRIAPASEYLIWDEGRYDEQKYH